jgi:hypothetical protein
MEKQTDHRISLEKKVIGSDTTRLTWGLVAGFVVAMTGLGISHYLIATGNGVAGAILSGVDIVSLAGTFIYGTATRRAERIEKQGACSDKTEKYPATPPPRPASGQPG